MLTLGLQSPKNLLKTSRFTAGLTSFARKLKNFTPCYLIDLFPTLPF